MLGSRAVRERLPGERKPDVCDYGCSDTEGCSIDRGSFDIDAWAIAQTWAICGGADRRAWPRAGGLDAQDAGLVAAFLAIDGMVHAARQRETERLVATVKPRR